jgi:hypothetical protein
MVKEPENSGSKHFSSKILKNEMAIFFLRDFKNENVASLQILQPRNKALPRHLSLLT